MDVDSTRTALFRRRVDRLALVVLVGWIGYDAAGKNLFGRLPWPQAVVDYRIMYDESRRIAVKGDYNEKCVFPYPPSAVVLLAATTRPPFPTAAALWLALVAGATLGTMILGGRLVGLHQRPWGWSATLVAYAVMNYYVQWDLRSLNCNMIYCFLFTAALSALLRGRDALAGPLLAAAVALKLYPALLAAYFAWIGRWRAAFWTAGWLFVFFVLLPAAVFGPTRVVEVYASWLRHLQYIRGYFAVNEHPILIAPHYSLVRRLGADSPLIPWVLGATTVLWLAAVGACVWFGRPRRERSRSGWDLAVDAGALTLAPVVVSPYLEAYHAVPGLLLALALARKAFDARNPLDARLISWGAILAGWTALTLGGSAGWRGFGVWGQMMLAVLALTYIRTKTVEDARQPN
ncbi:MAG: glycosyltransferase family 87 protein [Planctomycetia bacterium]